MKALFVSTSYPSNTLDWKGLFIRHLLYALAKDDELAIRVWAPAGEIPSQTQYCTSQEESAWLEELTRKGGIANIIRTKPIMGIFTGLKLVKLLRNACLRNLDVQIAHVNWLQNTLPFRKTKIPLVVSVLGSDFALLKMPGMVTMLRRVFKNRKVILCPNANWMVSDLNHLFGDLATIRYIPFGIEKRWFDINPQPANNQTRKWLVVLRITKSKIGQLFDWGQNLFNNTDELHLFGPIQEDVEIPTWVHYHGPTNPDELVNTWFPQASGLISLSEHDEGRPQILLEAMASRLPVIVSDIPAHKDVITDKKTGLIVNSKEAFTNALSWLQTNNNDATITDEAKRWVKSEFGTWEDCAQRYIDTYHYVLGDQ